MKIIECECPYSDSDDCAEATDQKRSRCPCLCHRVSDLERELEDARGRLADVEHPPGD